MPPTERAQTFADAPIGDLIGVLLRQMRRPLASHDFTMTDTEAVRMAHEWVEKHTLDSHDKLVAALVKTVTESQDVLTKMGLTFEKALDTDMNNLGGWQTTAEFLELANEKSNAELRIAVGAALALAFGDSRFKPALDHLVNGDYGDETIIARRIVEWVG